MSRDPLDRYYTPPELADACVRWFRRQWLMERRRQAREEATGCRWGERMATGRIEP